MVHDMTMCDFFEATKSYFTLSSPCHVFISVPEGGVKTHQLSCRKSSSIIMPWIRVYGEKFIFSQFRS